MFRLKWKKKEKALVFKLELPLGTSVLLGVGVREDVVFVGEVLLGVLGVVVDPRGQGGTRDEAGGNAGGSDELALVVLGERTDALEARDGDDLFGLLGGNFGVVDDGLGRGHVDLPCGCGLNGPITGPVISARLRQHFRVIVVKSKTWTRILTENRRKVQNQLLI